MAEAGLRLGQLLVKAGVVSEKQLADAVEVHRATGSPLGRVLVDLGYATQGAVLSVMAKQIGIEYIDFAEKRPEPGAVAIVPKELALRYTLMPVEIREGVLVVAMADPQNVLALDDVRIITKREIKPAISTKDDILAAVEEYYKVAEQTDMDGIFGGDELGEDELDQLTDVQSEAPAVKLVNYIIQKAVADRASDIHIEPQEHDLRVRFRIDGVLHEVMRSPKSIQMSIISRFKIMAEMDIAESRRAAGRSLRGDGGHHQARLPRLDAPDGLRRARRAQNPSQGLDPAAPRGPGLPAVVARALRELVQEAVRRHSRNRTHRFRESPRPSTPRSTCSTTRRDISSPPRTRSSTAFLA